MTGAIVADGPARGTPPVWATFYDIRRYGGLQIFLRAIIGGGSMVLSEPGEALADHVARLQCAGRHAYLRHAVALAQAVDERGGLAAFRRATSACPARSPTRPCSMVCARPFPTPRSVTPMPRPRPASALPSMTASKAFPPSLIGQNRDGVEMKVEDGSLRIRSTRTAHAYVGRNAAALTDGDGFVDTGDMVELRGDRYHFVGRRGGIINIGGLKVHPEEIEAVINRHDEVRMSRARSRKSPITGSIVVADVILADGCDVEPERRDPRRRFWPIAGRSWRRTRCPP